MKKRALISVSDKNGLVEFAAGLAKLGFDIISTGGTYQALADAGIAAAEVAEITGFAECLGGRVKTLHPAIHGGILARRENPADMRHLADLAIAPIDLVCVNLYPFEATIARPDAAFADAIENIDIGGPAMIRSAAKNHDSVVVVVDVLDYGGILAELAAGDIGENRRRALAGKAFAHTAAYDAMIGWYFDTIAENPYPERLTLTFNKLADLRYGENPHQTAAFYADPWPHSLSAAKQLGGRELSYNNINDADGALALVREFDEPAIVAVKHATPCGAAIAKTLTEAYRLAHMADPTSIFGGIIAANREIDGATAALIAEIFAEVIVAPGFSPEALAIFGKKKNLRLLQVDLAAGCTGPDIKRFAGGILIQSRDNILADADKIVVASDRAPSDAEMRDLHFAMALVKHTKSNGIALAKNGQSMGFGTGQVSRIKSTNQAIAHACEIFGKDALKGAVMASDAFFPFDDCATAAAAAGITAIIHPGGSKNDQATITACNNFNMAMLLTGTRHFRH